MRARAAIIEFQEESKGELYYHVCINSTAGLRR